MSDGHELKSGTKRVFLDAEMVKVAATNSPTNQYEAVELELSGYEQSPNGLAF